WTRTEPLVECTYRRCRGALCVGHRESPRRHVHVCRERRGGVGRNLESHRGPTWSGRPTILVRRAGDRRLGSEHGAILARLKQPCARQSRGRSRLVTDPALGHEVDRRRTHVGLRSRRIASRELAWPTSALALRDARQCRNVPPRLIPTLLTVGSPPRSSRRHESACHTNGAWPYCAGGMGDTSCCGLPRGSRKRAESAKGGGPGVGPLQRVRRTETRHSRCVAHLRLSALGPVDRDGT